MSQFKVQITKWVNGAPTVHKETPVSSKEVGFAVLREIGHSWDLNPNHVDIPAYAGYLYENDRMVGRLDVFKHTYRVYEVY